MDVLKEESDDEMILVVVGDDEGIVNYEYSPEPEMPVPISEKIELKEEFGDLSPTAVDHEELIKIETAVEDLDEKYTKQEDYLEEFTQDDSNTETIGTNISQNTRGPWKTHHEYLFDEDVYIPPKNKKRKTKVRPKRKLTPKANQKNVQNVRRKTKHASVTDEEDYLEIEFLEDDIKVSHKTPISNDDFTEVECLDAPSEKIVSMEHDEEYIPEEDEQEEDDQEDEEDFTDEEYEWPKRKRKTKTLSRRRTQTTPTIQVKKAQRPIKSFILELMKEQPHFKKNDEDLLEYLVDYMRKRRPPPPPPDYCNLDDNNMYCCSYCDISKLTEAAAGRHYQAAHGPRYLVCLACGSGFRSTVILYKHEKNCNGPGAEIQLRARGVFLGRKGRGRPYLTNNKFVPKEPPPGKPPKRIHVPYAAKTKYYCTDCPAYFTREILLDEHMHKHTGFRAFQCPECPVAYVSRYQLNKHSKKHNDEQFICDHCGKVFKLKTTLSLHMHTHLPRPRFGCGRCGRRYAKRAAVRSHIMRVHMNLPPPAACPVCPKRYNRMSHVKLHMKRDHGLILMTKRSIERNMPYMKVEDLDGAQIVFNKDDNEEIVDLTPILNEQILQ